MFRILVMVVLLAPAAGAIAAGTDGQLAVGDSAGFDVQAKAIQKGLADGNTYSELTAAQRGDIASALDRIRADLSSYGNVATMPEETKLKMFNDQELVNAILTAGREDSRMVCTRETPIGSHRQMTQCRTVAERRRDRENSQQALRDAQRPTALDPSH